MQLPSELYENFKYFYIKEVEISNHIELEWDSLDSDIKHLKIQLPAKDKWWGYISATNEDTQGKCYFYGTKEWEYIDEINLFIPEKYFSHTRIVKFCWLKSLFLGKCFSPDFTPGSYPRVFFQGRNPGA